MCADLRQPCAAGGTWKQFGPRACLLEKLTFRHATPTRISDIVNIATGAANTPNGSSDEASIHRKRPSREPTTPPAHAALIPLAIIALEILVLLLRPVYLSRLPVSTLLDRGWEFWQEGYYTDAERCYTLAEQKGADPQVMDATWHVFFWHKYHDTPLDVYPCNFLLHTPGISNWYQPYELKLRVRQEDRAERWLQAADWSKDSLYHEAVAAKLIDVYWLTHQAEVIQVTHAMYALRAHAYRQAWDDLQAMERESPAVALTFRQTAPLLWRGYAEAAWHTGHLATAKRFAAQYQQRAGVWVDTYDATPRGIARRNPARDRDEGITRMLAPQPPVSRR